RFRNRPAAFRVLWGRARGTAHAGRICRAELLLWIRLVPLAFFDTQHGTTGNTECTAMIPFQIDWSRSDASLEKNLPRALSVKTFQFPCLPCLPWFQQVFKVQPAVHSTTSRAPPLRPALPVARRQSRISEGCWPLRPAGHACADKTGRLRQAARW